MYRIIETHDFYPISILCHESGLEVKVSKTSPKGTLKMWRYEDELTGELIAAATLEKRNDVFVLGNLAVAELHRGKGFGEKLLKIAENEAGAMGAEKFWLVGKVPEFYKRYNWHEIDSEAAPEISKCQKCHQFGKSCFPSIMSKDLV